MPHQTSLLGYHAGNRILIDPGKSPGQLWLAVDPAMDGCRWARRQLAEAGCERRGRMPEQDGELSRDSVSWLWRAGAGAEPIGEMLRQLDSWQPPGMGAPTDLPEPGRWGIDYPRCLVLRWSRWGRAIVEISARTQYHRWMRDAGARDAQGGGLVLPEQAEPILQSALRDIGDEAPLIAPKGNMIGTA